MNQKCMTGLNDMAYPPDSLAVLVLGIGLSFTVQD